MSAKVPAVVRLAKQALTEDKCVVIGLQSTGEARTEEAVTKYVSITSVLHLVILMFFTSIMHSFLDNHKNLIISQGVELDDFVSGPRELLLKFVEENYPLPEKPEPLSGIFTRNCNYYSTLFPIELVNLKYDLVAGEESVKELQRKRHSARPDVSIKGRVRKVAKWQPASDDESDEDNDCESL